VAAFSRLVLSGGNHSFKVVMRPALKGGAPTPTVDTTGFDAVGEALMGGTSQCMAFYKGMRYPVILDKEYALQVIQLGEEQLVNGLRLGLGLAEQAADYKDQLRIITSAVLKQDKGTRSIEAAAASIESTEEEMTQYFFMNLASLLKLKKIPNDDSNGFLFMDISVQDGGETPQFNIAANGKMLPGCVSIVTEKSSTLREVLQGKNLAVPEDCKVLGAGVPVGFGLDTPFGDVVTKDMTIQLVVRLRGGTPVQLGQCNGHIDGQYCTKPAEPGTWRGHCGRCHRSMGKHFREELAALELDSDDDEFMPEQELQLSPLERRMNGLRARCNHYFHGPGGWGQCTQYVYMCAERGDRYCRNCQRRVDKDKLVDIMEGCF